MAKPTEQSRILAIIVKKNPKCTVAQAAKVFKVLQELGSPTK